MLKMMAGVYDDEPMSDDESASEDNSSIDDMWTKTEMITSPKKPELAAKKLDTPKKSERKITPAKQTARPAPQEAV